MLAEIQISDGMETDRARIERVAQFQLFARLESVDASRNRHRFYELTWQPTLWGEGALIRSWGRIGTKGRSLLAFHHNRAGVQPTVERVVRRRIRHGYRVIEFQ